MTQQLQIKGAILDIEAKTDKNNNPYFRLCLFKVPGRYFYAFKNNLNWQIWQDLQDRPHHLVNRPVLITYQELPNQNNQGTFLKVQEIEIM